jgi:hypothetical protein
MTQIMSQTALVSLPLKFEYIPWGKWHWGLESGATLVCGQAPFARSGLPEPWKLDEERGIPVGRNGIPVKLPARISVDPWKLREDFLNLPEDDRALVDFLNRTQYWNDRSPKTTNEYWSWQSLIRRALLRRPYGWSNLVRKFPVDQVLALRLGFAIDIEWKKGVAIGQVSADSPLQAIVATVQIDRMRGVRYDTCARPDCQRLYRIKTRHSRKYCTQKCAHLENVRAIRRGAYHGD